MQIPNKCMTSEIHFANCKQTWFWQWYNLVNIQNPVLYVTADDHIESGLWWSICPQYCNCCDVNNFPWHFLKIGNIMENGKFGGCFPFSGPTNIWMHLRLDSYNLPTMSTFPFRGRVFLSCHPKGQILSCRRGVYLGRSSWHQHFHAWYESIRALSFTITYAVLNVYTTSELKQWHTSLSSLFCF